MCGQGVGVVLPTAYMMVALGLHVVLALVFTIPGEEVSADCI